VKNTNFAVGGYRHCDKCGEEYHSSRHHTCDPSFSKVTSEEAEENRSRCLHCGCLLPDDGYYCSCDGVDLLQEETKDE
jgi:hypothetical protein